MSHLNSAFYHMRVFFCPATIVAVLSLTAQAPALPYSSTIRSKQMQNNLSFSKLYVIQIVRITLLKGGSSAQELK